MKILQIDEQRTWRGGEQQASWLIEGLVRRGHDVVISGRPNAPFLTAPHGGVPIERISLPFWSEADAWSALRLAGVVRRMGIDIIHAHSSHAHTAACLARRFTGRGKVVVHRRVSFPPRPGFVNRWKYGCPDRFVAVSGKVREVLVEYGIPDQRISMVYSAVDLERAEAAPLPRVELEVPDDAILLFSAGALVGHKDHETLINAMPEIIKSHPGVRLLIAGEGNLRPKIEAAIRELGLEQHVRLLGHRNDVPRILRSADLYLSSSWSEGLGTSVLEALAAKVPVVATVAGGIPEMILPGQTGTLVPNRNPAALARAVCAVLSDLGRASEWAEKGRRLVEERFAVNAMVEGNLRVYEALLSGGDPLI